MYCPICGTNLSDDAQNFCPNCGSKISNTVESLSTTTIATLVQTTQKTSGRPGPHSNKCLGFALASLIMGVASAAIGLVLIIILRIVGSMILLIVHIIGLNLGFSAKKHCKKAAEIEPSNHAEKAGSVIFIFGVVINAILLVIDIIFTIIFLIVLST